MTKITETLPIKKYIGNGTTKSFPFGFMYWDIEEIVVQLDSVKQTSGYVITSDDITKGGTVTFAAAPENGVKVTIRRIIENKRYSEFEESGLFRAPVVNGEFNRVVAQIQQLEETTERCVKVDVNDDNTPEELLAEVYQKLDSASAIAADARTAANAATAAASQAVSDITSAVNTATASINQTVSTSEASIASTINNAITNVTQAATSAAQQVIDNAAESATTTAKANINTYVTETVKPDLQTYVTATAESASAAASSATAAASSATTASGAVIDAENKQIQAAEYASAAEAHATSAKDWAIKTDGMVNGQDYSAKYYAQQSQSSAAQASISATEAESAKNTANQAVTELAGFDETVATAKNEITALAETEQTAISTLATTEKTSIETAADTAQTAAVTAIDTAKVEAVNDVTAAGTAIADYQQPIIQIAETSGTITLETTKIYQMTISGDTTFNLPTSVNTEYFNQIKVMAKVTGTPVITWGTTNFFNKTTPEIEAGSYDFYFDYDNLLGAWVAGSMPKGAAE